jgi:hypothetical protein
VIVTGKRQRSIMHVMQRRRGEEEDDDEDEDGKEMMNQMKDCD